MAQAQKIKIEQFLLNSSKLAKLKRRFHTNDNTVAILKAVDSVNDTLSLEYIFKKHQGVEITKLYE